MGKKLDLFAQVEVPSGVEPAEVLKVMEKAAIKQAWGFSGIVQPEDEAFKADLGLLNVQDEDDEEESRGY